MLFSIKVSFYDHWLEEIGGDNLYVSPNIQTFICNYASEMATSYLLILLQVITRLLIHEPCHFWKVAFDWLLTKQAVDLSTHLPGNKSEPTNQVRQSRYFVPYISLFSAFHSFSIKNWKSFTFRVRNSSCKHNGIIFVNYRNPFNFVSDFFFIFCMVELRKKFVRSL